MRYDTPVSELEIYNFQRVSVYEAYLSPQNREYSHSSFVLETGGNTSKARECSSSTPNHCI